MTYHDSTIVAQIRKDRQSGLSLRMLEKKYGIPNTTIGTWVRDIAIPNDKFSSTKRNLPFWKEQWVLNSNFEDIDKVTAQLLLSLLYWCEGAKYPSNSSVAYTSSDIQQVKVFLALLRKAHVINTEKIRCKLQIHSTHDYEAFLELWSKELGLSKDQFYKPTVTYAKFKRKRNNYKGTCTIKYFDIKLLFNIMGCYENFAKNLLGGIA